MKQLLTSIFAFITVWVLYGIIFKDFNASILILTIAGIITGYDIGKKQCSRDGD